MADEKKTHRITVMPGEGIGPEVVTATLAVLRRTGVPLTFEFADIGAVAAGKYGDPLPQETLESIRRNRVALKGPTATPIGEGARSVNVRLREELGLFAGVRPVSTLPGVPAIVDTDLVVIREQLEDLYLGIEAPAGSAFMEELRSLVQKHTGRMLPGDAGASLKHISHTNSLRIAEFAFQWARRHGRKKVTCVHKATIMKATDGIFYQAFERVREMHPDIEADHLLVDNATTQVVRRPWKRDVLLCPNLYGDILSDLCAGLVSDLGFAPGANIGHECAVFEAVHGTAPDIAGQGIANPTALILSAAMMLDHLGEEDAAQRVRAATKGVLSAGTHRTRDLDHRSTVTTMQFAEAVVARL